MKYRIIVGDMDAPVECPDGSCRYLHKVEELQDWFPLVIEIDTEEGTAEAVPVKI